MCRQADISQTVSLIFLPHNILSCFIMLPVHFIMFGWWSLKSLNIHSSETLQKELGKTLLFSLSCLFVFLSVGNMIDKQYINAPHCFLFIYLVANSQ